MDIIVNNNKIECTRLTHMSDLKDVLFICHIQPPGVMEFNDGDEVHIRLVRMNSRLSEGKLIIISNDNCYLLFKSKQVFKLRDHHHTKQSIKFKIIFHQHNFNYNFNLLTTSIETIQNATINELMVHADVLYNMIHQVEQHRLTFFS